MLTDDIVLMLRRRAREGNPVNQVHYAKQIGVKTETVGMAIRGKTYRHLNRLEAPVVKRSRKDDFKAKARKLYQTGHSYNHIKALLGISKSSISLWCRDLVDHKNYKVKRYVDPTKRLEARRLYQEEKKSCPQIAELLDMSTSTVSKWCGDLTKQRRIDDQLTRRQKESEDNKVKVRRPRHSILTDDEVISLRQRAKQEGQYKSSLWAKDFNVSPPTIRYAVLGMTFSYLDSIEAPFVAPPVLPKPKKKKRTSQAEDAVIAEALTKRFSNPSFWSYKQLALWVSEKTGLRYRGSHIALLLRRRDPATKELDEQQEKLNKIKPPAIRRHKIRKIMTAEQIAARRQKEKALKEAVAAANRYEEWAKAGFPEDWVNA